MPRRSTCCTGPWSSRPGNPGIGWGSRAAGSTACTGAWRPELARCLSQRRPEPARCWPVLSGEGPLLELLELLRRDGAAVEQLLALRDLVGGVAFRGDAA